MAKEPSPKKIRKLVSAIMPLLPLLTGMKIGEAVRRLSTPEPEKKDDE